MILPIGSIDEANLNKLFYYCIGEAWYTLIEMLFRSKNKTIYLHRIQTENTKKMTRMSLRIMMVATVNEEGSSCSKLAANFSRLAGLCIHILHQYSAPFKTFTSMHQCNAYVEYKLYCPLKLDYASTFCSNTLHPPKHLHRCINAVHM